MSNRYKMGSDLEQWMSGKNLNVTFILTQDCNLRCKYCYEVNKNNQNVMSFGTAKKAIDYILDNHDIFTSKAVIWDFIGGEPLLEIDLMDKIIDYIMMKTYKDNHPWFSFYRINISTNGILYNDEKVQKFLEKYKDKCSISISIDGNKEKHDLQRVYPNGRGSYDDVVKNIPLWLEQVSSAATKVTIGSDDIPYLKDSIIHLWNLGIKEVPANVVFEDVWKDGDDILFEKQLKELADYVIDNNLLDKYNTTLFSENLGGPYREEKLHQNSCGTGFMLAVDAKGNFYPCLRYAGFSLQDQAPYIIGNVEEGVNFDKLRPFLGATTENINDEECLECDIATGCSWCEGQCYDSSKIGTNYKRNKAICKMHKARFRANEYFWGRLRDEDGFEMKPKNRRKHLFFIMDDNCVEHCNYNSNSKENIMPDEILKSGLEFCEKNLYVPIILNSKNNSNIKNISRFSNIDRYEIYNNDTELINNKLKKIQVVTPETIDNSISTDTCILNLRENQIKDMYMYAKKLFKYCNRINLNIKDYTYNLDLNLYKEQLLKISKLLYEYSLKHENKEFNKISDLWYLEKMNNCDAGDKNFTLAPNGKLYICPKFYFNDKESYIGDIVNGIKLDYDNLLKLNYSPFCKECNKYQCDRCVYMNKKLTNEYNVPSALQCRISHIEKEVSDNFISNYTNSKIKDESYKPDKNYNSPVEKLYNEQIGETYDVNCFL
ncbi:radical SAM peptide maturase, CXXX-repeat target family [Clostridium botulinum]|nr:radical SAM peptide maturase, CXXX-repeat target family [Clostridium botulinum]NFB59240.1 radical SAM peptide maturase, CXXX-repeat target family [Clostridium botulinum]